jgi:hypothetical protein
MNYNSIIENALYTFITALIMSTAEIVVFYIMIRNDIVKGINSQLCGLKGIVNDPKLREKKITELINNINKIDNQPKKKIYKEILLELLKKDLNDIPNIFQKITDVYENNYIKNLINSNKFISIIIICVVILIIVFLFIAMKWNSYKFDKIGIISSIIAFLCIAGYQAWFTFNIGLNRKAYELPDFNKEVLPEIVNSKNPCQKTKKTKEIDKFLGVKRVKLKLDC